MCQMKVPPRKASSCLWMYTEVVQVPTKDSKWNPVLQKHIIFNDEAVVRGKFGLQNQPKTSTILISQFRTNNLDAMPPKRHKADPSEETLTLTEVHRQDSSTASRTTLYFIASEGIAGADRKEQHEKPNNSVLLKCSSH